MHKIGELKNVSKICKTCNLEKTEFALANKKIKDKSFFTPAQLKKILF